jgi:hypothetical protein
MAYQASKDKVLLDVGSFDSAAGDKIVARIVSYDGGAPKLALLKLFETKAGKTKASPLGRVAVDDVPELVNLIASAQRKWAAANASPASFKLDTAN